MGKYASKEAAPGTMIWPGSAGIVTYAGGATWGPPLESIAVIAYPPSGIPHSSGSSWGTSYTTTGSGNVIALAASPTFTGIVNSPKIISRDSGVSIGASFLYGGALMPINIVGGTNVGSYWRESFIGGNISIDPTTGKPCVETSNYRASAIGFGVDNTQGSIHFFTKANHTAGTPLDLAMEIQPTGNIIHYGNTYLNSVFVDHIGERNSTHGVAIDNKTSINGGLHVGGESDAGDNNLWIDGIAQEPNFISGWQGNNWQIQADGDAEFNNVLIRGGLSVYELIINQLHYQNGGLIIGAGAGKVATIETATVGSEVVTFHDPEGNDMVPFTAGAIVMVQRVDISKTVANGYTGDVVKKIVRQVASVSGMEVTLTSTAGWTPGDPAGDDTGIIEVGDEICAIGHVSNTSLDSALYLSATDSDNPFLRVMDGVSSYAKWSLGDKTTCKLQLGNLASLASYDIIPASPGYGLYCDNVYLNGRIVLPQAGMTNEGSSASDIRIYAGDSYANRAIAPFRVTQDGSLTATGVAELGTKAVSIEGTSQNIAIKGSEIWENSVNANGGTLYINAKSYNAGTSYYRSLYICDGKGSGIGHHLMTLTGGATPLITMGDLGHTEDILTFDVYGSQRVYKNLTCYEDFYVGGASEFVGAVDFDDAVNMLGNVAISGPHFKVPVKTQTQINAMTPTAGMIVYNTTNGHFYGYTNAWYQLDN